MNGFQFQKFINITEETSSKREEKEDSIKDMFCCIARMVGGIFLQETCPLVEEKMYYFFHLNSTCETSACIASMVDGIFLQETCPLVEVKMCSFFRLNSTLETSSKQQEFLIVLIEIIDLDHDSQKNHNWFHHFQQTYRMLPKKSRFSFPFRAYSYIL